MNLEKSLRFRVSKIIPGDVNAAPSVDHTLSSEVLEQIMYFSPGVHGRACG